MITLTSEQLEIAKLREGLHLAMAAAGSGKTRTLCEAAVALAYDLGPKVLVATFSRAARREFQERLAGRDKGCEITTWHAWGWGLLRETRAAKEILTSPLRVLRGIWIDQKLPEEQPNGSPGFTPELMAKRIRVAKLGGHLSCNPPAGWPGKWKSVYAEYNARAWEAGLCDFEDMLLRLVLMLQNDDELLEQVQRRYSAVLVDEAQDNNVLQWRLAELLSDGVRLTVGVGDLRQAIYGFAGATPQQAQRWVETRGASVHSITVNWRSTQEVVRAGNALVDAGGAAALQLGAPAQAVDGKTGPAPQLRQPATMRTEAAEVAGAIADEIKGGRSPKDIYVLYRTRRSSAYVSRSLLQAGVPHIIRGGRTLWELNHVRVLLDYLRVATGNDDVMGNALKRIYNTPKRYLGPKTVRRRKDQPWSLAQLTDESYGERHEERWGALTDDLDTIGAAPDPESALRRVLDLTSYGRDSHTLRQELAGKVDAPDAEGLLEEDWDVLFSMSSEYQNAKGLLDEVERLQGVVCTKEDEEPPDAVVLQTVHRSKGLEAESVHLVDAVEGNLPHGLALKEDEEEGGTAHFEEERRIAYVAITRAKTHLTVWAPQTDAWGRETKVSRFVTEAGIGANNA